MQLSDGTIFMASGWPGKGHGALLKKSLSNQPKDRIASKRSENTAKTLQNYGAESSIVAPRGAWRSFSTGCGVLGSSLRVSNSQATPNTTHLSDAPGADGCYSAPMCAHSGAARKANPPRGGGAKL